MMAKLLKDQLARGIICSSAGNHAQGVALASKTLGCDAVIVMPFTTPRIKWESVKRLGATVVLEGDSTCLRRKGTLILEPAGALALTCWCRSILQVL
ncbi:hypothetical protein QVD17_00646 [Tagetes erecta]|uniref:Tryptophan synthase beta chain-like PALP domain-containing protein n=1 Tax=Tagetes erecta TaxID=13708 RepID=A0AAD8LAL1_TARER|nr:hypothetical protein QVD17_00646 [Tagetes erecta]